MKKDPLELRSETDSIMKSHERIKADVSGTNERVAEQLAGFYRYIATLSSGAIVLSITFVGQFQNTLRKIPLVSISGVSVTNFWIMYVSWVLLLMATIASLYRNYIHTHYLHWAGLAEWVKSLKRVEELKIELFENDMVYNKQDTDIDIFKSNLQKYNKALDHNKGQEKRSSKIVAFLEGLAQVTFIAGLLSLVIFGIVTLGF